MEEETKQKIRTEKLKQLLQHIIIFFIVMFVLYFSSTITFPQIKLFQIILTIWGIALVAHAVFVFSFFGFLGQKLEDKQFHKSSLVTVDNN